MQKSVNKRLITSREQPPNFAPYAFTSYGAPNHAQSPRVDGTQIPLLNLIADYQTEAHPNSDMLKKLAPSKPPEKKEAQAGFQSAQNQELARKAHAKVEERWNRNEAAVKPPPGYDEHN